MDVASGDWFVGKAAASILVSHPTLGALEVFNTHVSHVSTGNLDGEMKDFWCISFSFTQEVVKMVQSTVEHIV